MHHLWFPVAGLVPATHVSAERSVEQKERVDGRVEPGHGDRALCWGPPETTDFVEPGHLWRKASHDDENEGRGPICNLKTFPGQSRIRSGRDIE